jgi:tetratricopeptide (TPR) repeat protein
MHRRRLSHEYWNMRLVLKEVRKWHGPEVIERVQTLARVLDERFYVNTPVSIAVSKELIRIAGEWSDVTSEALVHKNLELAYKEVGDYKRAMAQFKTAEALYRELGDGDQAAAVLICFGLADEDVFRDYASALTHYKDAYGLARSDYDRGAALLSMSLANDRLGNKELFEMQSREASRLMSKRNKDRKAAFDLFTQGKVQLYSGQDEAGRCSIRAAIEYFDEVGDDRSRARGVLGLGIGLALAAKRQESDEALNAALGLFEVVIDPLGTAEVHEWLAISAKVFGYGDEEIERHLDEVATAARQAAPPLRRGVESKIYSGTGSRAQPRKGPSIRGDNRWLS